MIKIFISHVCDSKESCALCTQLSTFFKADLPQSEIFYSCSGHYCVDASEINKEVDDSVIFIPIVSASYSNRQNCVEELRRARSSKNSTKKTPIIIPIRFGVEKEAMEKLEFSIDQANEKGEIWIDLSPSTMLDGMGARLVKLITEKSLELGLSADEDFLKDCKLLDLVLAEEDPTPFYVKTAISACRKGDEYGNYFFKKLTSPKWLPFFYVYGFFKANPEPFESDPQRQKGYYTIPFWPVLRYLEKISISDDLAIHKRLINIIFQVTRPLPPLKKADNYHTWHYFSKILGNLPVDVIDLTHIDLIRDWLEGRFDTSLVGSEIGKSLLPKLLKSEKPEDLGKAIKIVEIITELRWLPSGNTGGSEDIEPRLKIKSFWMRDIFNKNSVLLGERCGQEVISILKKRLTEILDKQKKERDFAYIWRPAIEPSEQNVGTDQPAHVLIDVLRDVLVSFVSSQNAPAEVMTLLESDDPIQKRIAVHLIDILYGKYQAILWKYLSYEWFERFQRHEVYLLLRNHFEEFSAEQKNGVFELIGHLTRDWKEPKDKARLDMLVRSEWLSAIVGKGYDRADALYEEYTMTLGHKPEHPEYLSFMSTSLGHERTISVEEIFAKGNVKDIIVFLNQYQGKTKWGEPADEGLGETLKSAVRTKQDFFESNLLEFINCKPVYQYYLISALEGIWNEKKAINWLKALEFCEAILKQTDFWDRTEPEKTRHFKKAWIPSAIAGLIQKGVGNDDWAFDSELLPQAGRILEEILEKEQPSAKGDREDALTEAINTTKGRVLGAFFSYALRQCRVLEKEGKEKTDFWEGSLKPVFDKELELTKNGNYEFSAIAGEYLPNLYYLSKDWVEQNISSLFPNKDAARFKNWRCAMDGYAYVGTIYTVIYDLLKYNGDLQKVIREVIDHKRIRERVIDNVCVTYLRGQEPLDGTDSLFREILEAWREEDIADVIGLFWQHRDADLQKEHKDRIFDFWRHCHERIVKDGEQKNQEILSDLNLLAVFLEDINDDAKKWLLQSASYVEKRWHSTFLLEYLNGLVDENPQAVGEIMMAMLKQATPNYQEEHIVSIVETLFKKGYKGLANDICDRYGRAGHEFLRLIYDKWNNR